MCLLAAFVLIILSEPLFAEASTSPLVIGVERLAATRSNLVEAGELLLSELRCVNCHRPEGALVERLPVHLGPNLKKLSERVHFDHVVTWLRDPNVVKPGTTMPHLLNGKSESEQKEIATALAHFLFSNQKRLGKNIKSGSAENGRILFHSIGCVSCHEPEPDFKPTHTSEEISRQPIQISSVPLGNLRKKYTFQGLAGFLLNPLESRPSAHMPRTPMTEMEANDLTAFLLGD